MEEDKGSPESAPDMDNTMEFDIKLDQRTNVTDSDLDLICRIKDMYRLLDLVVEQGSGGLGTLCFFDVTAT